MELNTNPHTAFGQKKVDFWGRVHPLLQTVFTSEIDISLVIRASWTSFFNTWVRQAAKLLSYLIQGDVLCSLLFMPRIF
jgi:hypothetical protein